MAEVSQELMELLKAALAKKGAKVKTAKPAGKSTLSDEQKAVNAKANEALAEAAFAKAGYKNNKARETIRTFGGWTQVGRKVKKGQSGLKIKKGGYALFHLDQTESLVSETKH